MTGSFDWGGFERTLTEGVVRAVTSTVREGQGERFYAAALDHVYRETDGRITLPVLALNSAESLERYPVEERADLRWSTADWDHYDDGWLGEDLARDWERRLTAEACRGTTRHWEATFHRYLTMLVRVCRRARTELRNGGVADRGFVLLLLDEEHHERLIKRVLTAAELRRHFPQFDEGTTELARVAALPPTERASYLVSRLGAFDGPVDSETAAAALRDLGPDAYPALLPMLARAGRAWQAAKLLADIGLPDDGVVRALTGALERTGDSDQSWVAMALSRLGRLDLVLDRAGDLPPDVVVSAVAAPYTGFRDHAVAPLPLDYRPLADVIARRPAYLPDLVERLAPGHSYCTITPDEVDEAVAGLASPHALVRRHAVSVLGVRALGARVGRRVLPLLGQAARRDPDPSVRRLAILSLLRWRRDARPFADVVRAALDDPATEVREAAAYWLREQGTDQPT
ncbi:DUF4303 domain-containing protein [Micromonospora sp. NPDC049559]|uniref:DUF4303 domain-containing protein n=1 Tax=Micromonospora sp. NPDC049559 TaxID=3155923 RepID=UPI003427E70F